MTTASDLALDGRQAASGARRIARKLIAFLALASLAGCAAEPVARPSARSAGVIPSSGPRLVALDAASCRSLLRDDAGGESLRQAASRNLEYLSRQPADKLFPMLDRKLSTWELRSMSEAIVAHAGDDWGDLCDRFRLYRAESGGTLLVTGYYQPELNASRKQTARFKYPLYRTPDDLVDVELRDFCPECPPKSLQARVKDGKLVPYYTRGEIDAGALSGRDQEIAWLDDPVEAYFLHVQGSALLRLEDGVLLQVGYSSSNGFPYTSIGRVLIDQGKLPRDSLSLQALKDYLRAHPQEQAPLMAANQRYIFFRGVVAGPVGSCGVPLTPGRSMAVDPSVYAHGGLAFLHIKPRAGASSPQRPYTRLMLMQDAGSAISGANRLDIYWGSGSAAEEIAGDMRNPGDIYVFLPS